MCEPARNILHSIVTGSMKGAPEHSLASSNRWRHTERKSLTKNEPSADNKYFFALVLAQSVLEPWEINFHCLQVTYVVYDIFVR